MKRFWQMLALVMCGEMIFSLPFHTARFFRPTFLQSFEFSNTELGDAFAVYGLVAMLSYPLGGWAADRFAPRLLITFSLLATAAGGLYMATLPGVVGMALLYGYWGLTSILLFWAALISATRSWGGRLSQGRAFGILEGGRGLVAACVALLAVAVLDGFISPELAQVDPQQRRAGMRGVILFYTACTALVALMAWYLVPSPEPVTRHQFNGAAVAFRQILKRPAIWGIAGVIVCAYCGYRGLDNYSLYAVQVLQMDEVAGARYTAWVNYVRPVAALAAGLLADRIRPSRTLCLLFVAVTVSWFILAQSSLATGSIWLVHLNVLISVFAVFAMRGVYFALVEETATPRNVTGLTVGLVSFIGFTPEIFFAPIGGRILDAAPGAQGFYHYFLLLSGIAFCGAVLSGIIWRGYRH